MTATPTRPRAAVGEPAGLRRELRMAQGLIVVAAAIVAVTELLSDTTAGFLAVVLLPFALIGLLTYGLAVEAGLPGRRARAAWLAPGLVTLAAVAAGGVFAFWGPWFWGVAYVAALVPAIGAAAWAGRR